MKYCAINGIQQTTIALAERGLAYGDGLFTTAKIEGGKVVLLTKHLDRLINGCAHLHLPKPDRLSLTEQLNHVAKDYSLAVLKVMITAGSGGRGYSRIGLGENSLNTIVMVSDFPEHYNRLALEGISLGDSKQYLSISPMLGGLKHLNRLEQVLLRDELDTRSEDDLVVTNYQGHVIEATSANLFYWLDGQLCTPDLQHSGVNGLIRQAILAKFPRTEIRETRLDDLKEAESILICNSLMGIIPVKTYNNRQLVIENVLQLQKQMQGSI